MEGSLWVLLQSFPLLKILAFIRAARFLVRRVLQVKWAYKQVHLQLSQTRATGLVAYTKDNKRHTTMQAAPPL